MQDKIVNWMLVVIVTVSGTIAIHYRWGTGAAILFCLLVVVLVGIHTANAPARRATEAAESKATAEANVAKARERYHPYGEPVDWDQWAVDQVDHLRSLSPAELHKLRSESAKLNPAPKEIPELGQ